MGYTEGNRHLQGGGDCPVRFVLQATKKTHWGQWYKSVIPTLGRLRLDGEFGASLKYIANSILGYIT